MSKRAYLMKSGLRAPVAWIISHLASVKVSIHFMLTCLLQHCKIFAERKGKNYIIYGILVPVEFLLAVVKMLGPG